MKAIQIQRYGGPEVLTLVEIAQPVPGPGEVLIRVEAAGVNYADTMRRRDRYPAPTPLPFVLGIEIAGTIVAHGEGVTQPALGTPVFAAPGSGGYAQFATASASQVIPIPPSLDAAHSTALLIQGLTAALTIKDAARLQNGESVLVQGAAGGVGVFAVQLAKLYGAGTVIGAASTEAKRSKARDLGADVTVDYTQPGWTDAVKAATGGRGADIILDMAGGSISEQSLDALAPFGRMIVYGMASGDPVSLDPTRLLFSNQTITGFGLPDWFARPDLIQERLGEIIGHVLSGRLKLSLDHVLPLAEAAEAHRLLETRQTTGKIVLIP